MNEGNCPDCGNGMIRGYIHCGNRLAWVPKVSKWSVEPNFNEGAVLLSGQNRFSINHVNAYSCETCKKVIIDYSAQVN
ncbi:PF20097 family protein [Bacillus sp. OxB-1]|uniref:PF20097 family protein n=1 Tax=Bacillus sp. (strain OxB-1) TaxID=98228 RepID=UPI000A6E665D